MMFRALLVALLGVFVYGCSPNIPVTQPAELPKKWDAIEDFAPIIERINAQGATLQGLLGKARLQFSEPGRSERVVAEFSSNRSQSIIILKNNLGIEGTRLLATEDSVLAYNKIERTLMKMHKDTYARVYLNGYIPLNLVTLLFPHVTSTQISGMFESAEHYLIRLHNGTEYVYRKADMGLVGIEYTRQSTGDFSSISLSDHALLGGFLVPRRIQLRSADGQSNLYLMVMEMTMNPASLQFDMDLPKGVPITRV